MQPQVNAANLSSGGAEKSPTGAGKCLEASPGGPAAGQSCAGAAQMHVCRLCDKLLSSSSSLDRHMLTHSGERPFVCKRCHMTFTTNGNMHRHMRTHLHKDSLARQQQEQLQLKQTLALGTTSSPAPNALASPLSTSANIAAASSQSQSQNRNQNRNQELNQNHLPHQHHPLHQHHLEHQAALSQQLAAHLQQPGGQLDQALGPSLAAALAVGDQQAHQNPVAALLNQQLVAAIQRRDQLNKGNISAAPSPFFNGHQAAPDALMMNAMSAAAAAGDLQQQPHSGLESVKAVMLAAAAAAAAAQTGPFPGAAPGGILMETTPAPPAHAERMRGKRRKQVNPSRAPASASPAASDTASSRASADHLRAGLAHADTDEDSRERPGPRQSDASGNDEDDEDDSLVAEQLVNKIKEEISQDFNNNNSDVAAAAANLQPRSQAKCDAQKQPPHSQADASEQQQRQQKQVAANVSSASWPLTRPANGDERSSANGRRGRADVVAAGRDESDDEGELALQLHEAERHFATRPRGHRDRLTAVGPEQANNNDIDQSDYNSTNSQVMRKFSHEEDLASDYERVDDHDANQGDVRRRELSSTGTPAGAKSCSPRASRSDDCDDADDESRSTSNSTASNSRVGVRQQLISSSRDIGNMNSDEDDNDNGDDDDDGDGDVDEDEDDENLTGRRQIERESSLISARISSSLEPQQQQQQQRQLQFTSINESDIIEDISQNYVKTANPNATRKGGKRNRHCYKCKLCTYSSVDRCTLVRHLRIHSGERPYICGICRYAFTTKANCERHVRKRHKKQYNSLGGSGGAKGSNGGGRSLIITDHSNHQTIPVKVNPVAAQTISQTLQRIQEKQQEQHSDDEGTHDAVDLVSASANHNKSAGSADCNIERISYHEVGVCGDSATRGHSNGANSNTRSSNGKRKHRSLEQELDPANLPAHQRRRLAAKQQLLSPGASLTDSFRTIDGAHNFNDPKNAFFPDPRSAFQLAGLPSAGNLHSMIGKASPLAADDPSNNNASELFVSLLAQLQQMTNQTGDHATCNSSAAFLPSAKPPTVQQASLPSTPVGLVDSPPIDSHRLNHNSHHQQVSSATFLANMLAAGRVIANDSHLQQRQQQQQIQPPVHQRQMAEQISSLLSTKHLSQQFNQLRNLNLQQNNTCFTRRNPFEPLTALELAAAQQALDLSCKFQTQK